MVIAVAWAPVILNFDTIVQYFQSFLGYVTMPVVVVLLGGIFWKRATAPAAFWTLVVATSIGVVGFVTGELLELHGIQFLYATGIMVVISMICFVTISVLTPAPDRASIKEVTFDRGTWAEETQQLQDKPWYQNYRWLSVGILVLTVGVVVPFI